MSHASYWPSLVDYQEALQSPYRAFRDPELQWGSPVTNKLGLPRPISGTFASVYELIDDHRHWAVKCFLRNIPDQHQRYAKISDHLAQCRIPYFVTFAYQNEGIQVQGKWFPLVKMEWDSGQLLNEYIQGNLARPRKLAKLAKRWVKLLDDLRGAAIAHGDLQHGNVLVRSNGSIRLIDYDGMWVPALEGETSHETGHPDYQPPQRSESDFHAGIDEFAGTIILITLEALQLDPDLWQRYNNGDNLLFRRQDYLNPSDAPLVADLRALGDDGIAEKLEALIGACGEGSGESRSESQVRGRPAEPAKSSPPIAGAPKPVKAEARQAAGARVASSSSSWLDDHIDDFPETVSPSAVASVATPAPSGATEHPKSLSGPRGEGKASSPPFTTFLRSLLRLLFKP